MSTIKTNFSNEAGLELSGRLELPSDEPQRFAVMSHCFTCNKDIIATYRISKQLANLGIACLRFDFRGLGDSQGRFVDSSFSTQIEDIDAAISFLAQEYSAPSLLIGHSLGGTASLACALKQSAIEAVATIASPSQPAHVLHHFGDAVIELNNGNNTHITVGGSQYEVSPAFVDDLLSFDMQDILASLHKPVMAFNVKGDDIVAESNAEEIVAWTAGASQLITLQDSDHLITDRASATHVAQHIKELADSL